MSPISLGTLPIIFLAFFITSPVSGMDSNEKAASEKFALGYQLLKQKNYAAAKAAFEYGVERNPSNTLGHFYLAEACRELKHWDCAERHYETSLDLDQTSSVAGLAKARLSKAKVWRYLGEAQASISSGSFSPDAVGQVRKQLETAKHIGLDDEQRIVHDQLTEELDQKAEDERYQKAVKELRSLQGRWRFMNGQSWYRAVVNNEGELEMHVEQPTERQAFAGLQAGARLLFSLKVQKSGSLYLGFYDENVRSLFNDGASYLLKGYRLAGAVFDKTQACDFRVSYEPIGVYMAYIPALDRIRILPYQILERNNSCKIELGDMSSGSYRGRQWIEEMVRQK